MWLSQAKKYITCCFSSWQLVARVTQICGDLGWKRRSQRRKKRKEMKCLQSSTVLLHTISCRFDWKVFVVFDNKSQFQDPVKCSDGFTYEELAIREWLLARRCSFHNLFHCINLFHNKLLNNIDINNFLLLIILILISYYWSKYSKEHITHDKSRVGGYPSNCRCRDFVEN